MKLTGKVVVVTGGASGIGRALCERFAAEGARGVVIADIDAAGCEQVRERIAHHTQALAVPTNVRVENEVQALVASALRVFGHIDLFCSNAGVFIPGSEEVPDGDWQRIWEINVMAHIFAARAVLPVMLARGEGYLLNTASAAGLLNQIGSAPYAVTKHAAVGFAEWLAITYGDRGIKVSVLCPQAVRTRMTAGGTGAAGVDGMLEPEALANTVVASLDAEHFLILPHPEVLTYMQRKTSDYDRWLAGMRRLQERFGSLAE
ncbi:MAG: SDR family oxidoreductase [Pseudomonadales bacterium]|nr:SDR family oxidoreductase [Pseudomonadales bacterium]MCP5356839.1 SDR family oxidoreductase [Pseudomonadales bacterium]